MPHALACLLLLSACAAKSPSLDLPADQATLADSVVLAHLGSAYPGAETVADLFDDGRSPTAAPDPSRWFDAARADHEALPPLAGGEELSVLSYNVGLLDRKYLLGLGHVFVPRLEDRRPVQLERLFEEAWDVLILQELWEWEDAEAFQAAAEAAGFVAYLGTEKGHPFHGVGLFVRDELVGGTISQTEVFYDVQKGIEKWPGPRLERAYLEWSFTHAVTGDQVVLLGTHLSPFVADWSIRDHQLRQLGLRVSELSSDALVLLGGDLNAGPYYAVDVWKNGAGEDVGEFWRNATTLPLLAHYGGLVDARVLVNPPDDVAEGQAVPVGGGVSYLETAYGQDGFCEQHLGTWTATDCNSLSFDNYAGDELPSRMDHVWLRDGTGSARVVDGGLAYVEVVEALGCELSDHYAPWVKLTLGGETPPPEPEPGEAASEEDEGAAAE